MHSVIDPGHHQSLLLSLLFSYVNELFCFASSSSLACEIFFLLLIFMNPISEYTVSYTHIVLIRSGIYESFVLLTRVALTLKNILWLLTDDDNVANGVIIEHIPGSMAGSVMDSRKLQCRGNGNNHLRCWLCIGAFIRVFNQHRFMSYLLNNANYVWPFKYHRADWPSSDWFFSLHVQVATTFKLTSLHKTSIAWINY